MSSNNQKIVEKEEEIENTEKNQSAHTILFKKITKEFFEFNSDNELKKANSYKILNVLLYKFNTQNASSLKKVKKNEDIELKKEKQFQIFTNKDKINYKNQESILKANFNNLLDYNFKNEQNKFSKRSFSFPKNKKVLNKNSAFSEKFTTMKSEIKNDFKSKINKNIKLNNLLTVSINDEKEEKNINKLNHIKQVNNIEGTKLNYNNLNNENLNKEINIDYNQNKNKNYIYKYPINNNINIFKNQQYYNNIFNPISKSSIYYRKNPNQNRYFNINVNPYFYNQSIYHGNYYNNYISKNFREKNDINNIKNSDEDKKLAKEAMSLVNTQSGSQILKERSLSNHYFANELLFPEIKNNLKEICCNIFGSSFMITLLDILSNKNIDIFLSLIENNLFDICLTEPGSRVIQKLLENINQFTLLINKFIFAINSKDIGILIKSQYGNYIFRKYLSKVKSKEYTNFIYNYIYNNFIEIIKEKYGICVVIKALSEADEEERKKLFEITLNNFEFVIKDCHGNYLIRNILLKIGGQNYEEILPIIVKIEENIVNYCKCQYSSSVIENCFEKGEQVIREHILKYLLEYQIDSIIDIIENPFGIYVIIKSLKINNIKLKEKLLQYIVNNIYKFQKKHYVNKIISSLSVENKEIFDKINKKMKVI